MNAEAEVALTAWFGQREPYSSLSLPCFACSMVSSECKQLSPSRLKGSIGHVTGSLRLCRAIIAFESSLMITELIRYCPIQGARRGGTRRTSQPAEADRFATPASVRWPNFLPDQKARKPLGGDPEGPGDSQACGVMERENGGASFHCCRERIPSGGRRKNATGWYRKPHASGLRRTNVSERDKSASQRRTHRENYGGE